MTDSDWRVTVRIPRETHARLKSHKRGGEAYTAVVARALDALQLEQSLPEQVRERAREIHPREYHVVASSDGLRDLVRALPEDGASTTDLVSRDDVGIKRAQSADHLKRLERHGVVVSGRDGMAYFWHPVALDRVLLDSEMQNVAVASATHSRLKDANRDYEKLSESLGRGLDALERADVVREVVGEGFDADASEVEE